MNNRKAMVLGSFIADALALGVHWVYNTHVIDKKFGIVDQYIDPLTSYHTGKQKGDFTHYGDQMLVLLESIKARGGFDLDHFAETWRTFFDSYGGYFDQATKATLQNIADGKGPKDCGSTSDELGGASRIPPLAYVYHDDPNQLIKAARLQTAFSHNTETVIDSAAFFSKAVLSVLGGSAPSAAIEDLLKTDFSGHPIEELVSLGIDSKDGDTRQVIADFGQMCEIDAALPATIHLIVKYESDYKQGMIENVMAGGDSAGRGMLAGMMLAAHGGMEAIPDAWLQGLTNRDRILAALESLENK
jgi:ADP-ribosylglycohydrolase